MCDDDDEYGPLDKDIDEAFDDLDRQVELARGSVRLKENPDAKFDVTERVIDLMMEEVDPERDIKIYQQIGETWVAEVKYHGINFVCVAGKEKPEFWDDFFNHDDDDDEEEWDQ